MAVITTNISCDLQKPVKVQYLDGVLFSQDNQANIINVAVYDGDEPASISGTVSANIIRSDGGTVAATGGTISGNVCSITLPSAAYAVPGVVSIIVKLTTDSVVTSIAAVVANIYQSSTDTAVDPGTIIPSIQTLISAIETAVASIPADYSSLWTSLAPAFNSSNSYSAGQYVTYNGAVYRFNTSHTGSWSSGDVTAVNLGGELTSLKSAVDSDLYYHQTDTDEFYWQAGKRVNSTKKNYAINQSQYGGLFRANGVNWQLVYPGSTIKANTGYTMDYSVVDQAGTISYEGQRGIAAGTVITISNKGYLLLSVTDGATTVSTDADAKALAKAGLTIDLVTTPVKTQVTTNTTEIETMKDGFYIVSENTDDFEWGTERRVNSIGTNYAINQSTYAGLFETFDTKLLYVYPGSTIKANTGYTLDYALSQNGTIKQFQRGVSAGTTVTINYEGSLRLSVSDGSSSTATKASAMAVAKAGLTISLKIKKLAKQVEKNKSDIEKLQNNDLTALVEAQRAIARDWHFGFINVSQSMELGSNHIIPGTKTIWSQSGTKDLDQKGVWMSDGVHPFKGDGVTDMYARTISEQLAMIPPSYRNGVGDTTPTLWNGRIMLWMGTSIPAGSDPDAGSGTGSTYPALVASQLGATVRNKAKGSSCVRINASTGEYTGMIYSHFLRSLARTIAECDAIAADWANIYTKISNAPSTLSADDLATMKSHSYENLLVPYLDGTYAMPDLFVIDHGHNDVRPKGIDGENDLWIEPTYKLISEGVLADDEYMTANSYANLKTALGNDLSAVGDIGAFAATLNRNCFKGAVNFIITVILKYNPYARIVIVSDYN